MSESELKRSICYDLVTLADTLLVLDANSFHKIIG